MSYDRRLDYLNKHRIIYRRNPINDKPTESFDWGFYYEHGTKECYELFRSKAKINTYKSFKWHLFVLWYLNPQLTQDAFTDLAEFISNRKNGFVIFNISPQLLDNIIYEVSLQDLESSPTNKLRKVIFKDNTGLSITEKLSIVGQIIGKSKKVSESDIYEAMLYMHDLNIKITIKKLAEHFNCTTRTIHRNMGNELKKEKELLNKNYDSNSN
jgi:hypothetical protein